MAALEAALITARELVAQRDAQLVEASQRSAAALRAAVQAATAKSAEAAARQQKEAVRTSPRA